MFEPDDDIMCKDPAHYPPRMYYFSQSGWWVCPSCGHRTRIIGPPTCTMRMNPYLTNDEWFTSPNSTHNVEDKLNTGGTILCKKK